MKQLLVFFSAMLVASLTLAQSPDTSTDNTKINKAPVNSTAKSSTADGQNNARTDLQITQQIRKAVIADKSLSAYGHNVKIVTVNGAVTLNGTVRNADEKSNILMKAQAVVGDGHVTDETKIKAK